jgi:DNA repair protein NreA
MPSVGEIKKRLEENWIQFLNSNYTKLSAETLSGSTPPSVFIGRYGYPKVKLGPMLPPLYGDTTVFDMPEMWLGKSIDQIVNYRLSLVRGLTEVNIHTTHGKYVESLQELAMARKSVESELTFEKRPIVDIEQEKDLVLDTDSAPFGPAAPIKTFKTSSFLSTDDRLENAFYDKDLRAADAISSLYKNGVQVSRIQRVLSMGMLGLQKNRKLVPTRWSISATDDVISADLIKDMQIYSTISSFEVYKYSHLDNYYSVILIPDDIWSFELQEAWFDNNGNLAISTDYENANGLDHYPLTAGAYFAARLAVAEYFTRRRKNGAALVLREVHPQYVMPVGVWQIREGIREAFRGELKQFDNFLNALSFACINLSTSIRDWISQSKMYKNRKEQTRIVDFFQNNLQKQDVL